MSQLNEIITLVNSWQETNQDRLSWDEYFMSTAFLISSRSPDKRLKVGCVFVKNNHIISLGYNGYLPSVPHLSFIENGHELATVHSEQNCIADCAKRGVETQNAIAYVTHYPCINCFKVLAAAGISTIYYHNDYHNHYLVNTLAQQSKIQIIKLLKKIEQLPSKEEEEIKQYYSDLRGLPKIKSLSEITFSDDLKDDFKK